MPAFCIPRQFIAKLKEAARAGDINIEKMYDMSSKERRGLFEKYVDTETAQGINAGFEKAMLSDQQSALNRWVQNTFTEKEKKTPQVKNILTKIDELNKQGLLTPEGETAFLEDLVTEKLGGKITAEEAQKISELSGDLEKHGQDRSKFNTNTLEYFKAKRKMEDYVDSLTPASNLRVLTSTIARGAMLLSVKSPLVNIISNSVMGFLATAERRIKQRNFNGFNSGFAMKFAKYSADIYRQTGYDLSRFQAFEGGRKSLGEEYAHSQGKGAVRRIGRFYEDIAFNKMQGLPDAMYAGFHFADSANLTSSMLAMKEGLKGSEAKTRALEIIRDAFNTAPETKEGQMVRAQAEADALYATYTNKTVASKTGLKLREVANTATGDLRLGDLSDPFVKTPANVLAAGLDFSGATVTAKMALGIGKVLNDVAHRRSFNADNFANVNQYFVRAGLGLTFAYVISQMIKPQDFLGQYPTTPTEQQLLQLRNGTVNAIRIGNRWISLDYLGPLGAPLLGFLYAKKYGGMNTADNVFRYGQGIKSTLQNFPGVNTIVQSYNYIKSPPDKKTGLKESSDQAEKGLVGMVASRIIPGIVNDISKMTDPYIRATDKNSLFSTLQSQIPGLREGLPISKTVFGDEQKTEPWLSTLLFGSRIKTAADGEVINELVNLHQEDSLPAITDVSKSSSRSKELKRQIGDTKFREAMDSLGKNLKQGFQDTIKDPEYQSLSSQEKKIMLDKVKESNFKDMLDTYGYEKPEK